MPARAEPRGVTEEEEFENLWDFEAVGVTRDPGRIKTPAGHRAPSHGNTARWAKHSMTAGYFDGCS